MPTVTVPVSCIVVKTLSLPPVKFACVGEMEKPGPPHDVVSELTQLLVTDADTVEALATMLAAVVVRVKLAPPFGFDMVTTEFDPKLLT